MILARGLPRIALLALTLHLSQPAAAQGIRSARIEGRVLDSARARPLVGARVVAVGPDARESVGGAALTDTSGQTATIDLGLPPSPTLRGALCPGVALPPQTGVMYGHVVDAETARSLPDVVLALSWGERDFDRATLRSVNHERTASATTDAGGWYRLCGVPTDTWLSFQLQHKGRTGPVLRVMVQDSLGLAVRHLSFAGSAAADAPDSLSSHAEGAIAPPPSGTARLSGIVRGAGDAPLALVDVGVRGTGAASRTDALGHYSLGGLPAGTQTLDIRRLGYDPAEFSVELRTGAIVTRDVHLRHIVSLDSVHVVAQRSHYREFNELANANRSGVFLDPEEMQWRIANRWQAT